MENGPRFEKVNESLVLPDENDFFVGEIDLSQCSNDPKSGKPFHFHLDGVKGRRGHVDRGTLNTHILYLGTTGSGKTKAIFQLLKQIKASMGESDVMVVFDTKGDYVQEFYNEENSEKRRGSDLVISLDEMDYLRNDLEYAKWNIFKEITADTQRYWDQNANEIARMLYDESVSQAKEPFFPKAASDVSRAVMLALLTDSFIGGTLPDNAKLQEVFRDYGAEQITALVKKYEDLAGVGKYIEGEESGQSKGVMSEIRIVGRDFLVGRFASQAGDFSVREFVRRKGGRTLFIEYDIGYGRLLTPIYRVLFDLAIKESLGRSAPEGNVFYVIDEFARLPNLYHIDDGVSVGRGLGARFLIGTQDVGQVFEQYQKGRGSSILANLGLLLAFRMGDKASRDVAIERYGHYKSRGIFAPMPGRPHFETMVDLGGIEDLELSQLPVGAAVICPPAQNPRRFQFMEYPSSKSTPRRRVCSGIDCQTPLAANAVYCRVCGQKQ